MMVRGSRHCWSPDQQKFIFAKQQAKVFLLRTLNHSQEKKELKSMKEIREDK